jgi:ABC-2 type transport system ATP-binding protein
MSNAATLSASLVQPVEPPPVRAALQARSLTKRFGNVTALEMLDLSILPGEIFCLLGANGAGKTTTINLFLGFTEPTAGYAFINGLDVTEYPLETKRFVGYIPEQVALYRNLTGLENLAYFAALATGRDVPRDVLLTYLAEAGLPGDVAERRVKEYSKGMRQKVAIALALAKRTTALLLDEPTSGLDPKAANEFSALLSRLANQGAAILMATHDLFRAKESGSRIGIMKHGRLVETLRTEDVGHADLEQLYLAHMRS